MHPRRLPTRTTVVVPALVWAVCAGLFAGPGGSAGAQTLVPNTFDADSYVFVGTNNAFSPELTVGVDLSEGGEGVYHFNFAVVAFDDLSAFDLTGDKHLRFEVDAYASTEVIDGFPVTTLSDTGSATLRVVALEQGYGAYLGSSDKRGWYDRYIGGAPSVGAASFSGLGVFDVEVTGAVDDWLSGSSANHGFALVLTGGDPVELGASEGGNGALLSDTPVAVPGDTDGDGDIDDADLGTAFSSFTGPIGAAGGKGVSEGDTDGDGDVDDADLANAFSGFTGPLTAAAVPEPGVPGLLGLGAWLMRGRRRRDWH